MDLLAAGWSAFAQGDHAAAEAAFAQAGDRPDALEGLATARWWQDDVDAAIALRERAYAMRRERGETIEATRLAGLLAWDHGAMRGHTAVANGWLRRARRLAADLPPSAEHAWLPLIEASFHLDTDAAAVLRLSTEALEHAHAHGGLDIEMTARTLQGLALVTLGRVGEGIPLLDEGAVAATSGELHDPLAIGSCCCNMVIACERIRDFDRAGEWCAQLEAFAERSGQRPLLALCRAHHGTVLTVRGDWAAADAALSWAASELTTLRPPLAGYARARLAGLRRRQGRPREVRETLRLAGGHVLAALVQAEISLDDGDPSAAIGHAARYLRGLGDDPSVEAAGALEVLVPAHAMTGEMSAAGAAHERLEALAGAAGTDALRGAERQAAGRLAESARDPAAACRAYEDAIELFHDAPYEASQARIGLARALAARDRPAAAREQAAAALAVLERLGARRAARDAQRLAERPGGLTVRELEVLALAAAGLSNRGIAERLVVSEHTVHRHMANIYVRLGVSTRAAAVAVAAERELLPPQDGPNGR